VTIGPNPLAGDAGWPRSEKPSPIPAPDELRQPPDAADGTMNLSPIVDPEIRTLNRPLSADEYTQLEKLIIDAGRAVDSLKLWNGILLDGHNRFEICTKHGLPFRTEDVAGIESRLDARIWVREHQIGRRNLSAYHRGLLVLGLEDDFREKGAICLGHD
jgi:hypothetical protein